MIMYLFLYSLEWQELLDDLDDQKVQNFFSNVTTSPVSSWPYSFTGDRVTDASAIQEQLAQQHSLRLHNTINSEERILRALDETR